MNIQWNLCGHWSDGWHLRLERIWYIKIVVVYFKDEFSKVSYVSFFWICWSFCKSIYVNVCSKGLKLFCVVCNILRIAISCVKGLMIDGIFSDCIVLPKAVIMLESESLHISIYEVKFFFVQNCFVHTVPTPVCLYVAIESLQSKSNILVTSIEHIELQFACYHMLKW